MSGDFLSKYERELAEYRAEIERLNRWTYRLIAVAVFISAINIVILIWAMVL